MGMMKHLNPVYGSPEYPDAPRRWYSFNVCPLCGGRATKIVCVHTLNHKCQQCGRSYQPLLLRKAQAE